MTSFIVQASAQSVAGSGAGSAQSVAGSGAGAQHKRFIPAQVRAGGTGNGVAKARKMSPASENGSIVVVDPNTGEETLNLSSSRDVLIAELHSAAEGRDPHRFYDHLVELLETEEGNALLTSAVVSCRNSPNQENIIACVSQLNPIDEALSDAFALLPQVTGPALSTLAHRNNQLVKAALLFLIHDRNARKVKQCVFLFYLFTSCLLVHSFSPRLAFRQSEKI
jgi:hypothetical protein